MASQTSASEGNRIPPRISNGRTWAQSEDSIKWGFNWPRKRVAKAIYRHEYTYFGALELAVRPSTQTRHFRHYTRYRRRKYSKRITLRNSQYGARIAVHTHSGEGSLLAERRHSFLIQFNDGFESIPEGGVGRRKRTLFNPYTDLADGHNERQLLAESCRMQLGS